MSSRIFSRIPFSIITLTLLVVVGCVALSGHHGAALTQKNHIKVASGKIEQVPFPKPFAEPPEVEIEDGLLYDVKIIERTKDHFTVPQRLAGTGDGLLDRDGRGG